LIIFQEKKAARRSSGRLAHSANLKPGYISPVRKMVIGARFQEKISLYTPFDPFYQSFCWPLKELPPDHV